MANLVYCRYTLPDEHGNRCAPVTYSGSLLSLEDLNWFCFRLPIYQLLEPLEDENIDSRSNNISVHLNHLGGIMLRTICDMNISNIILIFLHNEAPSKTYDNISEDNDPEMNDPHATFMQRKRPLVTWKKTATSKYSINKICSPKPPSNANQSN